MKNFFISFIGIFLHILSAMFGYFLAKIPHRLFLWHIKLLGFILYKLDKRRYNDALANLNFIYESKLSDESKHKIIRKAYDNFAFVILQTIRAVYLDKQKYLSCFTLIDEHYLVDCIKNDGQAVIISAHFGYWEAMAQAMPDRYRMCQMASLGRLTKFKSINEMIIKRREHYGVKLIEKGGAFKHLLKMYSNKNALVGILVDQNIGLNEGIEISFFGKRATHSTIASVLSRRFSIGIVPVFIDYNDDYSAFEIRYYPPIRAANTANMQKDILEATQAQADITQKVIESNPSSWFWFHKRFKIFHNEIYQKR